MTKRFAIARIFVAMFAVVVTFSPSLYAASEAAQPTSIQLLRPNAPGDETNWTPTHTMPNWDCVNDAIPDYEATRIRAFGPVRDLYNFESPSLSSEIINQITLYAIVDQGPGENNAISGVVKLGGDNIVYSGSPYLVIGSWRTYSWEWATNPSATDGQNPGGDWDPADFSDIQFGIELESVFYEYTEATQIYVEIEYGSRVEPEPEEQFVPEPSSALLLLTGLGALYGAAKLRKR